jgi:polyhydroxyalkanoate synthesis regulator phasin
MQEEVSVSSSKYQSAEVTLKSQIEEMEVELQRIVEDRQVESRQYGERVEELEDRVRELEGVEEELNNQI